MTTKAPVSAGAEETENETENGICLISWESAVGVKIVVVFLLLPSLSHLYSSLCPWLCTHIFNITSSSYFENPKRDVIETRDVPINK